MSTHHKLRSHANLEKKSRIAKAKKIADITGLSETKGKKVLDVGTGAGYIAAHLGKTHTVTSVDVNDERVEKKGYNFIKVDSEVLPVDKATHDFAISNQVIEHIPKQKEHIAELAKSLKKDATLYIATPNRFWIIDPHTKLPFINWMPRFMAGIYSRTAQKGIWDVYPISYRKLVAMLKAEGFEIVKDSYDVLEKISEDTSIKSIYKKIHAIVPKKVLRAMRHIYPSSIIVARRTIAE